MKIIIYHRQIFTKPQRIYIQYGQTKKSMYWFWVYCIMLLFCISCIAFKIPMKIAVLYALYICWHHWCINLLYGMTVFVWSNQSSVSLNSLKCHICSEQCINAYSFKNILYKLQTLNCLILILSIKWSMQDMAYQQWSPYKVTGVIPSTNCCICQD